jgi:hypothetical protein
MRYGMNKDNALDQLILWFSKPMPLELFKVSVPFVFFGMIMNPLFLDEKYYYQPAILTSFIGFFFSFLLSFYKTTKWFLKNNFMTYILERKMEDVPYCLYEKAMTISNDYTECCLAALECHESHLPGDCLLCGAK